MKKTRKWWPVVYGVLLTAYAVFTLLDAFVIPRDLVRVSETPPPVLSPPAVRRPDAAETAEPSNPPEVTENSYQSARVSVTVTRLERFDTAIYAAEVTLTDPACLRTGLAGGAFGRNVKETTSDMAEAAGAILAINGDYYGFRDAGFVMRNGYLYRDKPRVGEQEDLVIYDDGSMEIVPESESDAWALADAGAAQIFSFGPGLVQEGAVTVTEDQEVDQSMHSNPRTAIGEIAPLRYLFLVSDGRTEESAGLSLYQLAEVMRELGCRTAYNLDGGGSSTMWFMGRVINNPTSGWGVAERSVSDIVCIGE